ncbi:hypothetical protein BD311DRAFT_650157 [Dichomitus squalens]|uniref:Mid2 domain-containing protein n=1 Tax=Dichomitus squalens TaxID=114155 RepID=A0A4Q9N2F3_9APHY|nr:hypothetical protein BD311DRAFT_650157 [Dichomitus squalens]
MFARKSKVALTLFCLVVALGLATTSEANSLVHSPRDHADLNRMIKKRAPQIDIFPTGPIIGAEGTPTASASTDTASATSATSASTTSTGAASVTTGSSTSGTASATGATDSASVTGSSTSASSSSTTSSSSSSSATSSSSSSSSSSTSSSSSSTTDSQTSTSAPSTPTADAATDTLPSSTRTATRIVTASTSDQPTGSAGASVSSGINSNNGSHITRTTLTVIIVIAASIGFIALAWTLFRKWKLRPSSNFDDRMQPIDWQPTGPEESGLPTVRRVNSTASHGSFQSSGHGHGGLDPLPEHDFTAGPTALAPVGGYADLQRGPSPQPMAQLQRGPSATRADYSAYDYNNGVRY